MNTLKVDANLTYDGTQLRSHWIYETLGLEGDSIVYFVGPCDVPTEHLVDMVDRRKCDCIKAATMLHFIVEHFDADLKCAVLCQRLLVTHAADVISAQSGMAVRRDGDDLFIGDHKLSVSIATVSPVSALIHLGINVDASGAPVPAVGLKELDLSPLAVGEEIAEEYAEEQRQVAAACHKVKWVK